MTRLFNFIRRTSSHVLALVALFGVSAAFTGCKEDISEDNYAIKSEMTMTDYLVANSDKFSSLKSIFDRVKLGNTDEASSLTSVLSARGNYTLFAPNNDAIQKYVESLGLTSISELTYDQAQLIANSCLIDNGDDAAYEEADFPTPGTFAQTNLNDRLLTCEMDTAQGESWYVINGSSRVVTTNAEVSNGMVHEISSVIAPSSDNVYELIAAADNMKIMARLINETTWSDSMAVADRDVDYENEDHDETYTQSGVGTKFTVMQRRYIGFTALVETDDVFQSEWGITAQYDAEGNITEASWNEIYPIILEKCQEAYGTDAAGDLSNPDNAVNRFVAYHFMYGKMAYDRFVHHYNEYQYKYGDSKKPKTDDLPVNVWDYYTTMGKYSGLIKITQVGDTGFEQDKDHKIYANRISNYNDSRSGDYREISVDDPGILISASNGSNDNNAQNGYYFPINKVLLYSNATRQALGRERIRIDITTMLPEIASNSCRGTGYYRFPNSYFDNITNESTGTVLLYLHAAYSESGTSWRDYQGDEVMVCGLYDFVLKLPPVPYDGTYEIRMGSSHNTLRGMAQIYFGSDPLRLGPVGLPYDMRQTVGTSAVPWEEDVEGDDETNAENDRNMRNQGYMKAPNYICVTDGVGNTPLRTVGGSSAAIRRIVTTHDMKANETYYLRFKSALKKLDSQLFLDYFEFVPTNVYNGTTAEDIW